MLEYNYHSNFHHYFDRNENLNVFFSFNFIKFLRTVTKIPLKFFLENSNFLKNNFDINLYLEGEDGVYNKVYIKKFDLVRREYLFNNTDVTTFFGLIDIKNIKGKYRITAEINYKYDLYDYINYQLKYENLTYENRSSFLNLKLIMEQNYINYEQNSPNIVNNYSFSSDNINFDRKKIYLSSLYDVYKNNINFEEYNNFISGASDIKNVSYDGAVPITKFIANEVYSLDGETDKQNYMDTMMRLIQDSDIVSDYKQMCFDQNIFKVTQDIERKKYKVNPSYEVLSNSLTTTVCDNNLFVIENNVKEIQGTDILYVASFFNNIPTFSENDYWKEDITKIPIYLVDILAKTKIYYLSSVDSDSLSESWKTLDNITLQRLKSGRYLCKINSDLNYINDYLIENYFVLVK